jgi:hypothetical protein
LVEGDAAPGFGFDGGGDVERGVVDAGVAAPPLGVAGGVAAGAGGEVAGTGATGAACVRAWPTPALRIGGNSSVWLKYPGTCNSTVGNRPIGRQPVAVIVTVVSSAVLLSAQSHA